MATDADNLDQAISNVCAQLASLTASPKPTYQIGGKQVSWTEHFTALTQQLDALRLQRQRADGAFEVRSVGA